MYNPSDASTAFAFALDGIEGVGRVTAGRLLSHFETYDDLLRYPREQVLTRLKGLPGSAALTGRLFDETEMRGRLAAAAEALAALGQRGVTVLHPRHAHWPTGLDRLPRGRRPFLLYAYGPAEALATPLVAVLARPPLDEHAFETAQDLLRHLSAHGVGPVSAALGGFDVVVHKINAGAAAPPPAVLVASCGMARLHPPLRPTVSAAVRAGGVFLSPFAMEHGPFDHDDAERALVQAALASAAVFVAPATGTPEWQAMEVALEAGLPVFGIPRAESAEVDTSLPERVHIINGPVDFDWVYAATQTPAAR